MGDDERFAKSLGLFNLAEWKSASTSMFREEDALKEEEIVQQNRISLGTRGGNSRRSLRFSVFRGALREHQRFQGISENFLSNKKNNSIKISGNLFRGKTRIQMLVGGLVECLDDLGCTATDQQLEKWACLIYESMSAPSRTFHSVQHVFDVAVGADSVQKLAAFFHDIIYYSIDGGLSEGQSKILKDIINEEGDEVYITKEKMDTTISMVMDIFGFTPGMRLDKFKGLNEFLSACLALRCYENNLDPEILAAIAACIEATIPFRKPDSKGRTPAEVLFQRIKKANCDYNLELNEDELIGVIQRAVDLGNRDLANFSTPEHAVFLSMTWNLLPESNISLRNTTAFRISDFAFALKKMAGFFEVLDPTVIFMSFGDEAHLQRVEEKTEKARKNIQIAMKYMRCKGMAISVVAAIAQLTGGDAPLALFLGDLPEQHHTSISIDDLIGTDYEADGPVELDEVVLQLLKNGRESESKFDIKNSPLAAYLYTLMGDKGLEECYKHVVHPMNDEHSKKLLDEIPACAAIKILDTSAQIAVTRAAALNMLRLQYEEKI